MRTGRQFSSPDFSNYQGVILAEFVLAELLVAASPIATRQPSPGAEKLSPYIPRDMTKMLSIGLLYFLLELMSVANARWGRIGAWFGGLILLAVGLNEAANITKILNIFGTDNTVSGTVTPAEAAGGTITGNNAFAGQPGIPASFGKLPSGVADKGISGDAFAGQPGIPTNFGQLGG